MKDNVSTLAYELYKLDWMRRISAERQMDLLKDFYQEQPDCTFEEYVEDQGYQGELYVCFDEFLEAEYLDAEYMKELLDNPQLFDEYEQALAKREVPPMRQDRIYKSLPIDDFMDQCSFVFAKGGYWLLPLIQEVNHERKVRPESDEVLKKRFLERATETVRNVLKEDIDVFDSGNYYTVWLKVKA